MGGIDCHQTVKLPNNLQNDLRGNDLSIIDAIWYLNDHYRWSREAIAEWLEAIYPTLKRTDGAKSKAEPKPESTAEPRVVKDDALLAV